MTYRELLELYKQGKLEENKKHEVESDIERQEAISDYLFDRDAVDNDIFSDDKNLVGLLKRTENPEVNIQYGLLPQKYEHCIQNLGVTVSINHEQYKLYSIKELFTNVNIDGHCYAQIRQLQGFSNTLNELSEISSKEREVLNDALAIGEGDGSVLFALPKDFELSVFYTDGSYISPLHLTINSLIKKITNIK